MENLQLNFVVTSNMSPFIAEIRQATAAVAQFQKANAGNAVATSKMAQAYDNFNTNLLKSGQFHSQVVSIRSEADKLGSSLSAGKLHWQDALKHVREYRSQMGAISQLAEKQVRLQQGFVSGARKSDSGALTARVTTPAELQNMSSFATRAGVATEKLRGLHEVVKLGANDFINLGKNTQWAGRQMMVGLSLPIGMAVGMATKAFVDMDKELVRIQKVYGAGLNQNAEDFKKQGEVIRADAMQTAQVLASQWGQASSTTLKLEGDLAAVGKTGQELQDSVKQMSRLSILGEIDPNAAMKAGLALQTAFKQNNAELTKSIDFMNAVENQTSTSMNDLVEAIPRAGATIHNLGGNIQELSLYMTALREGGVSAGEGANALKSGLAAIMAPADGVKKKLKDVGIDMEAIVNQGAGNLTKTLMLVGKEMEKLDPVQKTQAMVNLFGRFQFNKMAALLNNLGKEGSQTLKVLELINMSPAELAKSSEVEMNAVTESASGKFKRMFESMKVSMAILGKDFAGPLTKVVGAITNLVNAFNGMPDITKKIIEWGAIIAALVGPIVMVAGVFMNFIGTVVKGAVLFGAIFKKGLRGGWKEASADLSGAQAMAEGLVKPFEAAATATETLAGSLRVLVKELQDAKIAGGMLGGNAGSVTNSLAGYHNKNTGDGTGTYMESQQSNEQTAHRPVQSWTVDSLVNQGDREAAARRLATMKVGNDAIAAGELPGLKHFDGNREDYARTIRDAQTDPEMYGKKDKARGGRVVTEEQAMKARSSVDKAVAAWAEESAVADKLTVETDKAKVNMHQYAQEVLEQGAKISAGPGGKGGNDPLFRRFTSAATATQIPAVGTGGSAPVDMNRVPVVAPTDVARLREAGAEPVVPFYGEEGTTKSGERRWLKPQAGHGIANADMKVIGAGGAPNASMADVDKGHEILRQIGIEGEKEVEQIDETTRDEEKVSESAKKLAAKQEELAAVQERRAELEQRRLGGTPSTAFQSMSLGGQQLTTSPRGVGSATVTDTARSTIVRKLEAQGVYETKVHDRIIRALENEARTWELKNKKTIAEDPYQAEHRLLNRVLTDERYAAEQSAKDKKKKTQEERDLYRQEKAIRKDIAKLEKEELAAQSGSTSASKDKEKSDKQAAAEARGQRRSGMMGKASGVAGGLGMAAMMMPASEGTSAQATAMSIIGAGGMGSMVGGMTGIPGGAIIGAALGAGYEALNKLKESAERASSTILRMSEAFNKATQGFSSEAIVAAGGQAIDAAAITLDDAVKSTVGVTTSSIKDSVEVALGMTSAKIVSGAKVGGDINTPGVTVPGANSGQGINLWAAGISGTTGQGTGIHENIQSSGSRGTLGEHVGDRSSTINERIGSSRPPANSTSSGSTNLWTSALSLTAGASGASNLASIQSQLKRTIGGAIDANVKNAVSQVTTGVSTGASSGKTSGFNAVTSGIAKLPDELYHNLTQQYVEKYGKQQVEALKVLDNSRALDAAETMYMQLVNNNVPGIKAKEIVDEIAFQAGHADIKMKLKLLPEGQDSWQTFLDQGRRNYLKMSKDAADTLGKDMEAAYREAGKQWAARISEALIAGLKGGGIDGDKYKEVVSGSIADAQRGVHLKSGQDPNIGKAAEIGVAGILTGPLSTAMTGDPQKLAKKMGLGVEKGLGTSDVEVMTHALGLPNNADMEAIKTRYEMSSNKVRAQIENDVSDKMRGSLKGLTAAGDEVMSVILKTQPKEVQALADSLQNFGDGMTSTAAGELAIATAHDKKWQETLDRMALMGDDAQSASRVMNEALATGLDVRTAMAFKTVLNNVGAELGDLRDKGTGVKINIDTRSAELARMQVRGFKIDWDDLSRSTSQKDFEIRVTRQEINMGMGGLTSAAQSMLDKPKDRGDATAALQKSNEEAQAEQQKADEAAAKADEERIAEMEKAFAAEEEAMQKAMDAAQKAREEEIARVEKFYDDKIEAINKAEEARKKAFEAEKKRQEREKTWQGLQLDMAKALAKGDAFGVVKAKMDMKSTQKGWRSEDKDAAASDAAKAKTDKLGKEKATVTGNLKKKGDALTAADKDKLDSLKKLHQAQLDAERKAAKDAADARKAALDQMTKDNKAAVDQQAADAKAASDAEAAEYTAKMQEIEKVMNDSTLTRDQQMAELARITGKNITTVMEGFKAELLKMGIGEDLVKSIMDPLNNMPLDVIADAVGMAMAGKKEPAQALLAEAQKRVDQYLANKPSDAAPGGSTPSGGQNPDAGPKDIFGRIGDVAKYAWHAMTDGSPSPEDKPTPWAPSKNAEGGYIRGPGGPTSDSISAHLSNGEYVIRAAAVSKYGKSFFDKVNAKKFAAGGPVGKLDAKDGTAGASIPGAPTAAGKVEEALSDATQKLSDDRTAGDKKAIKTDKDLAAQKIKSTEAAFTTALDDATTMNTRQTQMENVLYALKQTHIAALLKQTTDAEAVMNAAIVYRKQLQMVSFNELQARNAALISDFNAQWTAWRDKTVSDIKEAASQLQTSFANIDYKKLVDMVDAFATGDTSGTGASTQQQLLAKAEGGYVSGPGSATSDSIPARLSNGEYVIKQASVSRYGTGFLDKVNSGSISPGATANFAEGGLVGSLDQVVSKKLNDASASVVQKAIDAKNATLSAAAGGTGTWNGVILSPEQVTKIRGQFKFADVLAGGSYSDTNGKYYNDGGGPHSVQTGPIALWSLPENAWGVNDIAAEDGTPIYAYADGTIIWARNGGGWDPGYVKQSINAFPGGEVLYGHTPPGGMTVKEGDSVKAGQMIARTGTSNNGFAHLHIEWHDVPTLTQRDTGGMVPWLAQGGFISPALMALARDHKIGANPAAWNLQARQVRAAAGPGSSGPFNSIVPTGQMASDIWRWLIGQGLSEAGAAGVMGNLNQESSLDPSVEESGGTGIGLVQWSFGRADDLRNFAASRGKPWQDLNTQLEFFLSEINGSGEWSAMWNALKTIQDVDEATALFHDTFEKSNDRNVGTYGERPADAHNFYNNFATGVKKADGGYISGPGTGTSDSIPARLSNGEYVIKQSSVSKYGTSFLDKINSGRLGFADGGLIKRGITTVGDKEIAAIFQTAMDAANLKRWVTIPEVAKTAAKTAVDAGKAQVKDGLLYGVTAQTIIEHAKQALGTPYSTENRAGGPGKGFDCSSFAYWAYEGYPGLMKNGWGPNVGWTGTLKDEGKPRDMSAIKAGDILLHDPDSTGGHAALYIGNGQIQHSANPNQIASVDVWGGFEQARQILAMANGGLVIPALRKGATINYDNTLANLHAGEAVLTAPLTQKLNQGIDNLASGSTVAYNVSVNIDKANATPYEIEQAVYSALNKKEIRSGRSRVIGGNR